MQFSEFVLHQNFLNHLTHIKPHKKLKLINIKIGENIPSRNDRPSSILPQSKSKSKNRICLSTEKKQIQQHSKEINKNDKNKLIERTKQLIRSGDKREIMWESRRGDEERKRMSTSFRGRVGFLSSRYQGYEEDHENEENFFTSREKKGKDFFGSAIHRTVIRTARKKEQSNESPRVLALRLNRTSQGRRKSIQNRKTQQFRRRPTSTQVRYANQSPQRKSSDLLQPW